MYKLMIGNNLEDIFCDGDLVTIWPKTMEKAMYVAIEITEAGGAVVLCKCSDDDEQEEEDNE